MCVQWILSEGREREAHKPPLFRNLSSLLAASPVKTYNNEWFTLGMYKKVRDTSSEVTQSSRSPRLQCHQSGGIPRAQTETLLFWGRKLLLCSLKAFLYYSFIHCLSASHVSKQNGWRVHHKYNSDLRWVTERRDFLEKNQALGLTPHEHLPAERPWCF